MAKKEKYYPSTTGRKTRTHTAEQVPGDAYPAANSIAVGTFRDIQSLQSPFVYGTRLNVNSGSKGVKKPANQASRKVKSKKRRG